MTGGAGLIDREVCAGGAEHVGWQWTGKELGEGQA